MTMLSDAEARVLLLSLPTGIIDSKCLFGPTPQETRRLRTAFAALLTADYLSEHIVAHDKTAGRDFRRSYITQAGVDALCTTLPSTHPLQKYHDLPVNIRSGRNESHLSRMVRYADVSCFLACAGAETALTCPLTLGCNPFFVGAPPLLHDSPNLEDQLKKELVNHCQALPALSSSSTGAVYFQSDYVRIANKYNNNTGLLIDFGHKDVYMVFKSLFRTPLRWYGETYRTCLALYHRYYFDRWGIRNTINGNLRDAILIVDTKSELLAYLDQASKYRSPFAHLFVFLRRAEGFEDLRYLLEHGLVTTLENHLEIAKREHGVTGKIDQNGATIIRYNGNRCLLGTLLDVAAAGNWKKIYEQSKDDAAYYLCFEDQVEYYARAVNLKYLLPIPRS